MKQLLTLLCALALCSSALAEGLTVHIACAANFRSTLEQLKDRYQQTTGQQVIISSGATGLLYAQIVNGARFDALLAADTWRPQRLVDENLAFPETLATYAIGQLGLVSHTALPTTPADELITIKARLAEPTARVAIANPHTAPYGNAARQTLQTLDLWPGNEDKGTQRVSAQPMPKNIVIANNVAQAFQFFTTGNARYALVGPAQWRHWAQTDQRQVWPIPANFHATLAQGAVVPRNASRPDLGKQFIAFLLSAPARAIIEGAGYLPQPERTQ